jgi:hypothetical protein
MIQWFFSSECQGKLSFFYSGAGRRCSPQCPEGGKTLQPRSEESVCFWKRGCAKRLDNVTYWVLRKGPGCSASERTGSLVKTKMRWTSPYFMDEVSMRDPQQRHVPMGRGIQDASGVLATTWSERRGMELGKPSSTDGRHNATQMLIEPCLSYKATKWRGRGQGGG